MLNFIRNILPGFLLVLGIVCIIVGIFSENIQVTWEIWTGFKESADPKTASYTAGVCLIICSYFASKLPKYNSEYRKKKQEKIFTRIEEES